MNKQETRSRLGAAAEAPSCPSCKQEWYSIVDEFEGGCMRYYHGNDTSCLVNYSDIPNYVKPQGEENANNNTARN